MNTDSTFAHGIVEVVAKYPRLAFVYSWFKPTIEIDGELCQKPWGAYEFALPAGTHIISVSYPWLLAPRCGENSVTVELRPGSRIRVEYMARYIRYLPGKIKVTEVLAG